MINNIVRVGVFLRSVSWTTCVAVKGSSCSSFGDTLQPEPAPASSSSTCCTKPNINSGLEEEKEEKEIEKRKEEEA